jgi:phospholipid-binding lipoprotein MlaA
VTLLARLFLVLAVAAAAGCATSGGEADPRDPYEGFNRSVYRFNEGFDEAIAKPVATAYRDLLHEEIRSRVRNFFANIADLLIGLNNFLQGKPLEGMEDWARFAFNSTFGLFGLHDMASDMGIEKHNEDFGQTFGRWGAPDGPYLVLPLLGSSTVRDGVGTLLDWRFDPVTHSFHPNRVRNSLVVTRLVNTRADLLDASRLLEEAALDKYVFQRDAYLQRRRSLIHDGRSPREPLEREPAGEDKKSGADPVNPAAGPRAGTSYLPRAPRNYDAVMSALAPRSRDEILSARH